MLSTTYIDLNVDISANKISVYTSFERRINLVLKTSVSIRFTVDRKRLFETNIDTSVIVIVANKCAPIVSH